MDGPRNYHNKQSKSEREKQVPYNITYTWNIKQTYGNKGKGGRGIRQELGINRYRLLYT